MEYLELGWIPLVACLVVASLHTWFGIHVVRREIIFIDLALAQVAAVGAALGLLFDMEPGTPGSYTLSFSFTVLCAWMFATMRTGKTRVSKEAYIGITYAAAAALAVLILDKTPEGAEHLKNFLVGTILTVGGGEILVLAIVYAGAAVLLKFSGPSSPDIPGEPSMLREFFFYMTFGVVVTLSVKIMGVLLVFSFLIIPSVCALKLAGNFRPQLFYGWAVSLAASLLGIILSFAADFPTGASIVMGFVIVLVVLLLFHKMGFTRQTS